MDDSCPVAVSRHISSKYFLFSKEILFNTIFEKLSSLHSHQNCVRN